MNKFKTLCVTLLSVASIAYANHNSHKVQIFIDKDAPWFKYAANIGGAIVNNIFAPRPMGSSIFINGLIFPKGTVNVKTQTSFLVDKIGNPLTEANSVGEWRSEGFQLINWNPLAPTTLGERLEDSRWTFDFKDCNGENLLFSFGTTEILNNFAPNLIYPNNLIQQAFFSVIKGYGENHDHNHMTMKAKVYLAPDTQALIIKVKFSEKIEYDGPNC